MAKNYQPTRPVTMIPNSGRKKAKPDPAAVIAVGNKELEKLIEHFGETQLAGRGSKDPQTLMEAQKSMQDVIERLRDSIVFLPGKQPEPGKFELKSALVNLKRDGEEEGRHFIAVFTSLSQIKPGLLPDQTPIMSVPFPMVCDLAVNFAGAGHELEGVMVNPQTKRFGIPLNLVKVINEAEKQRRQTGEKKPIGISSTPKIPKIENPEADALVAEFAKSQDPEEKNNIINRLYDAIWSKPILVPSFVSSEKKMGPCLFTNKENGNSGTAAYTSAECLKMAPEKSVPAIMTFEQAVREVIRISKIQPEEGKTPVNGISLITPPGSSIFFTIPLLDRFVQVADRRKAAKENPDLQTPKTVAEKVIPPKQKITLTPQMRAGLEHIKFELTFLPEKFFTEGQALVDDICSRRETCLDELFEASYTNPREYPYLEEEFSVMAVSVREDLEIIRVDFPEQDQVVNCAARAYLVWNPKEQKGQYYAAVRTAGKDSREHIMRADGSGQLADLGETAVEGNELSYITELADRFKDGIKEEE